MSHAPAHRPQDCFAVIRPFVEAYAGDLTVQIMGGISTAALCTTASVIDVEHQVITVPDSFSLSTRRPDGTIRDADVLVLSAEPERIQKVTHDLAYVVGTALEPSVFGIRSAAQLQRQLTHPLDPRNFGIFLGDRYEWPDGKGYARALFPFMTPLSQESLEPWSLVRGDMVIPVPNPATSLINYYSRSITSLRRKDVEKIGTVVAAVFAKCPELHDYLQTGPLQGELEFAQVIASLTGSAISSLTANNSHVYSSDELMEHAFFMPKQLPPNLQRLVMSTTVFKARGLKWFEGHSAVVTFWQKYVERFASVFTGTASS